MLTFLVTFNLASVQLFLYNVGIGKGYKKGDTNNTVY